MNRIIHTLWYPGDFLFVLLLAIIAIIPACDDNPVNHNPTPEPGFALTFDDAYVSEWYGLKDTLTSHNVRATFFVTRFDQLADGEIAMLLELQQAGHEIGSHGLNHLNAVTFLKDGDPEDYIAQEVVPSLKLMRESGLNPVSFAYPFGENTPELDNLILEQVSIIRDVTEVQRTARTIPVTEIDDVFCEEYGSRIVAGLGIDSTFKVSLEELDDAFARAASRNEVIVMYAHRPVESVEGLYECDIDYLCALFGLADKHGLRSYTIRELPNR